MEELKKPDVSRCFDHADKICTNLKAVMYEMLQRIEDSEKQIVTILVLSVMITSFIKAGRKTDEATECRSKLEETTKRLLIEIFNTLCEGDGLNLLLINASQSKEGH